MSFRLKLLLAMMLVVGVVTTTTLFATQHSVKKAYEQIFEEQFKNQITYFTQLREARLARPREESLAFVNSVRLKAAMVEYRDQKTDETAKDIYQNLRNALPELGARLYGRILDAKGNVIPPPDTPRHGH